MSLQKKYQLILLSTIWFCVGVFLLRRGILFSLDLSSETNTSFVFAYLSSLLQDSLQIGLLLIVLGLFIGHFKAVKVFTKVAGRVLSNLDNFPDPAPIQAVFNLRFFLLIAAMMALGVSLTLLGCPLDLRAIVNVAIGSALIRGAIILQRKRAAALASR